MHLLALGTTAPLTLMPQSKSWAKEFKASDKSTKQANNFLMVVLCWLVVSKCRQLNTARTDKFCSERISSQCGGGSGGSQSAPNSEQYYNTMGGRGTLLQRQNSMASEFSLLVTQYMHVHW